MLGENNYSSYEVKDDKVPFASFSLPDGFRIERHFEEELTVAAELAGRLLKAVEAIYAGLGLEVNTDTDELAAIVTSVAESIQRNPYPWMYICHEKHKESYLIEHAFRTGIYSLCIGVVSGLDTKQLTELGLAATLSDVGKIKIPKLILEKVGALNSAEHAVIRVHPLEGRKLLRNFTELSDVIVDVVVSHHEQVDGQGYPAGLQSESLSTAARIVAIADAFDAMTSERSYAGARTISDAVGILWQRKDIQFDAELVERFLMLVGTHPVGSAFERQEPQARATILEPDLEFSRTGGACYRVMLEEQNKTTRIETIFVSAAEAEFYGTGISLSALHPLEFCSKLALSQRANLLKLVG